MSLRRLLVWQCFNSVMGPIEAVFKATNATKDGITIFTGPWQREWKIFYNRVRSHFGDQWFGFWILLWPFVWRFWHGNASGSIFVTTTTIEAQDEGKENYQDKARQ